MKYIVSLVLVLMSAATLFAQDTPTPDPLIAAVIAASEPIVLQEYEFGDQLASVTIYPCVDVEGQEMSYERLDITDDSTGETHTIDDQLLLCEGLGAAGLSIIHWSENGAFLYYTDAREGVPDGLSIGWVPPLWRVRLDDLHVDQLGSARFLFNRQSLLAWDAAQVSVLSTNEGTAVNYPLQPANLMIIDVMWLPDATGIIYIQADALIAGSRSTVTHIDLETEEQTILLDTAD